MSNKAKKIQNRKNLRNELWRASDIMRRDDGTTGVYEYIEQISWMFFLRVFENLEDRYETENELEGKKYSRIISKEYSWKKWTNIDSREIISFINNELFPHLSSLSGNTEKDTIGKIFSEIQRNKMKSASNFLDVIDILKLIDFNRQEDSHILSGFYEELLVKLGKESGVAGEFYTPRPIVRFMVKVLDPKFSVNDKDFRILDPFCGSCGFLVETLNHLKRKKIPSKSLKFLQKNSFYGFEKKSLPFLVGLMNCILHELMSPNVLRRNALTDNILNYGLEDKVDYIFTNPPFGGQENKNIQQNFPVKVQATELLALQLVMRRLKENGKCGIVVPEGILHGTVTAQPSFASVKKELLENYNVHTIISLPAGVFANVSPSGTGPKANILFFEKKGKTKRIWYYHLEPPNGKRYTKNNLIIDEHLEDCLQKFKNKDLSANSWFVDVKEIVKNEYEMVYKPKRKLGGKKHKNPDEILTMLKTLNNSINDDVRNIEKIMNEFS